MRRSRILISALLIASAACAGSGGDGRAASPTSPGAPFTPSQPVVNSPTQLSATFVPPNKLRLTWVDNSEIETEYRIEHAMSASGPWTETVLAANTVNYLYEGPRVGLSLYFRVRASVANIYSAYSSVLDAFLPYGEVSIAPSGKLAIITVSPSDYTAIQSGTLANMPSLTKSVLPRLVDDTDFIFFLANGVIPSTVSVAGVYYTVSSTTTGIGRAPHNNTAQYGSAGRLQGVIEMPDRGFLFTGPSLHELAHRWGNFTVPTTVGSHFGYSSAGLQLGGFDARTFRALGNNTYEASNGFNNRSFGFGSFANGGNGVPYSDYELYLMGLIEPTQVSPVLVANDPVLLSHAPGKTTFTATRIDTLTIQQLIARNGARLPGPGSAPNRFRVLVVLYTVQEPAAAELAVVERDLDRLVLAGPDGTSLYNFWEATRGLASLEAPQVRLRQSVLATR